MKYTKFYPTQVLNTRTEEWEEIDSLYKSTNYMEMDGFLKIIPIVDNIFMIVWDDNNFSTYNTLYKGILE